MDIVCVGGGPAGLYFALLMKRSNPAHRIRVIERNRPYDTFGWGVVFSDATLENMRRCDAQSAEDIEAAFNHWDDIETHIHGRVIRSGGHGFVGIGRKRLLNLLQARCEQEGVELLFETEVSATLDGLKADLVVASDGVNSRIRERFADVFRPDIVTRPNRFIWLGVKKTYDAFTFLFEKTEHGWFQAHVYQFDAETSTFIVEAPEAVWKAHGLDAADTAASIDFCERVFAKNLQGAPLLSNARHLRGSAWLNFQRIVCQRWWHVHDGTPVVLMGDAVHTAHFAIGSGTKLAIEDAIELAALLGPSGSPTAAPTDWPHLLQRYQASRSVDVLRLQNAAWNAMEWFEVCGDRYCDTLPPEQFMVSLLTRSQRISHENLRLRDATWLEGYERWFAHRAAAALGVDAGVQASTAPPAAAKPTPPMFTPVRFRGLSLKNRVVVSPMAQYKAVDGLPTDWHLMHLGARAVGGAALVMAEMTCTRADARITLGCPGLWNDDQQHAWSRIVDFVHQHSDAAIGMQLGHAGAKGSTALGWEGSDEVALNEAEGAWPLWSASALPYRPGVGMPPRELARSDMHRIRDDFVAATRRAALAGFDWLEMHAAHGYLLSAFLSPLTNRRTDAFGGSLANRLKFPLEVFVAMREAWPASRPMSVRVSAHDWVPGGLTPADAVEIARAFKAVGCDLIDCSSGQVSIEQKPVYGRLYQTPFADRIRNEAGIATMAVGAITDGDQVNGIIAAGRADLCAVARPHLANPAWTLTEAAKLGYAPMAWPKPYLAGKPQMESLFARERAAQADALQQARLQGTRKLKGDEA
jgi:anthraniloyl-CoA monooxygenase